MAHKQRRRLPWGLEIVCPPTESRGLVPLPKRWVVERGFTWLGPLTIVAKTTAEPPITFTTQVARTERTTTPQRPLLKVAK